jgi:hypothetical protein
MLRLVVLQPPGCIGSRLLSAANLGAPVLFRRVLLTVRPAAVVAAPAHRRESQHGPDRQREGFGLEAEFRLGFET